MFNKKLKLEVAEMRTELEKRDSYTDTLVSLIQQRSTGKAQYTPDQTSALEMASGLVQRAFQSAEIKDASDEVTSTLTPDFLGMLGRALIRRGEFVAVIDVDDSGLRLHPATIHSIVGSYKEEDWLYNVNLAGPSELTNKDVRANGLLHFMYSQDPGKPWRGIGPMASAQLGAQLSGNLLGALGAETRAPVGSVLPMPATDGQDETVSVLKQDLRSLKGDMALVESMESSWQSGQESTSNWQQKRIGALVPQELINLQSVATAELLGAMGIPGSLFNTEADGASSREAFRLALSALIQPLSVNVERELRRKLDQPQLRIEFRELQAADIQAKARSFKSLIDGGMSIEEAAGASGILVE